MKKYTLFVFIVALVCCQCHWTATSTKIQTSDQIEFLPKLAGSVSLHVSPNGRYVAGQQLADHDRYSLSCSVNSYDLDKAFVLVLDRTTSSVQRFEGCALTSPNDEGFVPVLLSGEKVVTVQPAGSSPFNVPLNDHGELRSIKASPSGQTFAAVYLLHDYTNGPSTGGRGHGFVYLYSASGQKKKSFDLAPVSDFALSDDGFILAVSHIHEGLTLIDLRFNKVTRVERQTIFPDIPVTHADYFLRFTSGSHDLIVRQENELTLFSIDQMKVLHHVDLDPAVYSKIQPDLELFGLYHLRDFIDRGDGTLILFEHVDTRGDSSAMLGLTSVVYARIYVLNWETGRVDLIKDDRVYKQAPYAVVVDISGKILTTSSTKK